MKSSFNHQKKLNSFRKQLEKAQNHCGSIWKNSLNTTKQSFWYHDKSSRLVSIYNDLLQHEPPKIPWKRQSKFIPNKAPEDTKIRKDLTVEKFLSEIKLLQTQTERYEQRISKLDCDMTAYLQTQFDDDIVTKLSRQWKKEWESQENSTKSNFEEKEEWYIENSTEEFSRGTTKETLIKETLIIDTTNQTSRNVNFIQQNKSEHYEKNIRQTQYQRTATNFKSS